MSEQIENPILKENLREVYRQQTPSPYLVTRVLAEVEAPSSLFNFKIVSSLLVVLVLSIASGMILQRNINHSAHDINQAGYERLDIDPQRVARQIRNMPSISNLPPMPGLRDITTPESLPISSLEICFYPPKGDMQC